MVGVVVVAQRTQSQQTELPTMLVAVVVVVADMCAMDIQVHSAAMY
jgi:hypothetical protein